MNRWGRIALVIPLAAALSTSGCAVMRRAAVSMAAPMAANVSASLQQQTDPELVRDGSPAFLLLLDGLVQGSPNDPTLLLAAADAQISYATAFVGRDELERAAAMYAKARDYGLRVLAKNRAFHKVMDKPLAEFEQALPAFRKKDVPALYTTATAWAGWIISSPSSMQAISELSKAMALVKRVLELDPSYQRGGADTFMGIYYAVQPRGAGRDLEASKKHFERAFELAGPDYLPPRVAFAEFYARYAFDRELFESTLKNVLQHPTSDASLALANEVARRRAGKLLEAADDFF